MKLKIEQNRERQWDEKISLGIKTQELIKNFLEGWQKQKYNSQSSNIRNEIEDITIDLAVIKKIIK